ncbi:hypothetical protein DFJ63DRAFT_333954 [Scheffersomyces coipomensis]|uniref:uncharacterized protein n=1 Tax=Scheffersomyces coipomensis TaxID=1788519 RepID=UPI00315CB8F3
MSRSSSRNMRRLKNRSSSESMRSVPSEDQSIHSHPTTIQEGIELQNVNPPPPEVPISPPYPKKDKLTVFGWIAEMWSNFFKHLSDFTLFMRVLSLKECFSLYNLYTISGCTDNSIPTDEELKQIMELQNQQIENLQQSICDRTKINKNQSHKYFILILSLSPIQSQITDLKSNNIDYERRIKTLMSSNNNRRSIQISNSTLPNSNDLKLLTSNDSTFSKNLTKLVYQGQPPPIDY